MNTVIKEKWFFAAQRKMTEKLDHSFLRYHCNYQVVTKDRIIEGYTAHRKNSTEPIMIEVQITKRGAGVGLFIYEVQLLSAEHLINA